MINIAISSLISIISFLILFFLDVPLWISIPAGIASFLASMYFLGKNVMTIVNDIVNNAMKELQAGRVDNSIRILNTGYKYINRHPFIKSQLNAQIGVIYYVKKDFDKAFEYLKDSFVKHWVAQGMLAVIYMKRYDQKMMKEIFEKATRANSNEGFLWNLYAYCLSKVGKQEEAIEVLVRAKKKNPMDDKIAGNLNALQNNDKFKMKNYGDLWYQFHLEKIPTSQRQKIVNTYGRRKFF